MLCYVMLCYVMLCYEAVAEGIFEIELAEGNSSSGNGRSIQRMA